MSVDYLIKISDKDSIPAEAIKRVSIFEDIESDPKFSTYLIEVYVDSIFVSLDHGNNVLIGNSYDTKAQAQGELTRITKEVNAYHAAKLGLGSKTSII